MEIGTSASDGGFHEELPDKADSGKNAILSEAPFGLGLNGAFIGRYDVGKRGGPSSFPAAPSVGKVEFMGEFFIRGAGSQRDTTMAGIQSEPGKGTEIEISIAVPENSDHPTANPKATPDLPLRYPWILSMRRKNRSGKMEFMKNLMERRTKLNIVNVSVDAVEVI